MTISALILRIRPVTLLKAKVYPGGNYLMNNMSKHERAGGTSKMLEQ